MNASSRQTVGLQHPISFDGKTVDKITMRRCTVSDSMQAAKGNPTPEVQEVRIMSILTGLPEEAIGLLDIQDYLEVQSVLEGFTKRRPKPISGAPS